MTKIIGEISTVHGEPVEPRFQKVIGLRQAQSERFYGIHVIPAKAGIQKKKWIGVSLLPLASGFRRNDGRKYKMLFVTGCWWNDPLDI